MKRIILLLSAVLIAVCARAATIRGYVVDAETGEGLAAASVFVAGTSVGTTADTKGYFEIDIENHNEISASYVGYSTTSVKASRNVEIRLQRSTELRDVRVYGSRGNFGVQSSQM